MFGSDILDVAVGVVLVYLLLALVVSAVQEMIARSLKLRYRMLRKGVTELLQDDRSAPPDPFTKRVLDHPLLQGLGRTPSYIPAPVFARALVETITGEAERIDGADRSAPDDLRDGIQNLRQGAGGAALGERLARSLQSLAASAPDIATVEANVAEWFDNGMQRVTGWYKRQAQLIMLGLAILIVFAFNVDTIVLVEGLQTDPAIRDATVEVAERQVAAGEPSPVDLDTAISDLNELKLPIGQWVDGDDDPETPPGPLDIPGDGWGWFFKVLGLLVTAVAVSFGAPFWFDLLSKLVSLRSSGGQPAVPAAPAGGNGGGGANPLAGARVSAGAARTDGTARGD